MGEVDTEVRLEVLSALTGVNVKSKSKLTRSSNTRELNIYNFVTSALTDHANIPHHAVLGVLNSRIHKGLFVDTDVFFDPKFDYDFTHLRDDSICMRGDEPYKRPCGWYRIALNVLGKYPDGNAWLGTNGWRSYSVAGEWPVSYHGTSIEGAKGIVTSHYRTGPRELYGRGIYSTYDIYQASGYSKEFTSKRTGKNYSVIMQNRINPQMRKVCYRKDYWLIEVPQGTPPTEEKEIVEKSIRPYGILLKEV